MTSTPGKTRQVVSRPFQDDDDFWKVRDLLSRTYPTAPPAFNWEIRRWDGWRFYNSKPDFDPHWRDQVRVWETTDGELVGVVHPEGIGDAHLDVNPQYRHIEADMIAWALDHLPSHVSNGNKRILRILAHEYDSLRCRLLEQFGFEKTTTGEIQRRLRLSDKHVPEPTMDPAYSLRTVDAGDPNDCRQIARLLNAAFNRDFHTAEEYHVFTRNAPCYHADLDLAAIAPDGSFAAYVGIPCVEENRYAVFEPTCTHPDHQRKGLARSLMLEGLHRLENLGAVEAWVGTGIQSAANKLYDDIGFTEIYTKYMWRRVI